MGEAIKRKVICDLRLSADGVGIRKGGRLVACFPVDEYGSMIEAHMAAEEYRHEFGGGEVVGYVELWECKRV